MMVANYVTHNISHKTYKADNSLIKNVLTFFDGDVENNSLKFLMYL